MGYRIPYCSADLGLASPQPRHQITLRDHRYGPVHHVVCLFTRQLLLSTYVAYPQRLGEMDGLWTHWQSRRTGLNKPCPSPELEQMEGCPRLSWVAESVPRWFTRPKTVTHPRTN